MRGKSFGRLDASSQSTLENVMTTPPVVILFVMATISIYLRPRCKVNFYFALLWRMFGMGLNVNFVEV